MSERTKVAIVVGALAVVLVGGALWLGRPSTPVTTSAPPTSSTAATSTPTTLATTSSTAAPSCPPADPRMVALITAGLTGDAKTIGEAVMLDQGPLVWIGANIYDAGGRRISSDDVWIITGGAAYALSGSAREYGALLPDGRKLPSGPNAGDDTGQAVQACTVQS